MAVVTKTPGGMFGIYAVCLFVLCLPVAYHNAAARLTSSNYYTGSNTGVQWMLPREYSFVSDLGVMFRRVDLSSDGICSYCLSSDECVTMSSVKCKYYLETNQLLTENQPEKPENSNLQLRAEVDAMLFKIIEKRDAFVDCIPYISKYTDCTKDTICTGCKTCDCNSKGHWNCTTEQKCRPEFVKPIPDHSTLVMVLEKLKQAEPISRLKRSLDEFYHIYDDDIERHAKLAEWIYGEPTLKVDSLEPTLINEHRKSKPEIVNRYWYEHLNGYKNLEPSKTINSHKDNPNLLNMIVNTIIQDTLPQVFRENNIQWESNRGKRMIQNDTNNKKGNKLMMEELSSWLYRVHPLMYLEKGNIIDDNNIVNGTGRDTKNFTGSETAEYSGPISTNDDPVLSSNPDYLAFEEVYNNIVDENKNYSRRKPPLDLKAPIDLEFNMYDDKYYNEDLTKTEVVDSNVKMLVNELGVTLAPGVTSVTEEIADYYLSSVTEVVVDLLESAKKNELNLDYAELGNKIDNPPFDNIDVKNSGVNIMKREVSTNKSMKLLSDTTNTSTNVNMSSPLDNLKKNVVGPIAKMIIDKGKEMEDLLTVRNRLVEFINTHKNSNLTDNDNNYYSVYQVEILPHRHHESYNIQRSNTTLINSYLEKLKHDVYLIIRDIVALRKLYTDSSMMPENLKFLIKALKHYIHRQGFYFQKKPKLRQSKNTKDSIKLTIIEIIELLDKQLPKSDSLEPLSPHARRVLQRIIKKNYVDEFTATGLRVYDSEYNLTKDLESVGSQWHIIAEKIDRSSVLEQLYYMKQLQLILCVDLAKMNDALALINFAKSRRMIPLNGGIVGNVLSNIGKGISWLKTTLVQITQRKKQRPNKMAVPRTKSTPIVVEKKIKKNESVLSQIKTLLKKSKKDLMNLLSKKVPKADIVKEIARKNIEAINNEKYEDTMQKWQTNLNIVRKKRSPFIDRLNRRIKNILPKYLRGKVSKHNNSTKNNVTHDYKSARFTRDTKLTKSDKGMNDSPNTETVNHLTRSDKIAKDENTDKLIKLTKQTKPTKYIKSATAKDTKMGTIAVKPSKFTKNITFTKNILPAKQTQLTKDTMHTKSIYSSNSTHHPTAGSNASNDFRGTKNIKPATKFTEVNKFTKNKYTKITKQIKLALNSKLIHFSKFTKDTMRMKPINRIKSTYIPTAGHTAHKNYKVTKTTKNIKPTTTTEHTKHIKLIENTMHTEPINHKIISTHRPTAGQTKATKNSEVAKATAKHITFTKRTTDTLHHHRI